MTLDRMNAVLDNYIVLVRREEQTIIPEMNFTCNGSITTLIFTAQWRQNGAALPELQIWRPGNVTGTYMKVGSTMINVAEENDTQLYYYSLGDNNSPLQFQEQDIIGFYQPVSDSSQLVLRRAVRMPRPYQSVYSRDGNPNNRVFNISNLTETTRRSHNLILNVKTGKGPKLLH